MIANLTNTFVSLSQQRGASMCFPYVHAVSAEKGSGIKELKLAIGGIYGNKNREVIEGTVVVSKDGMIH